VDECQNVYVAKILATGQTKTAYANLSLFQFLLSWVAHGGVRSIDLFTAAARLLCRAGKRDALVFPAGDPRLARGLEDISRGRVQLLSLPVLGGATANRPFTRQAGLERCRDLNSSFPAGRGCLGGGAWLVCVRSSV
jgi:hypothetical protein